MSSAINSVRDFLALHARHGESSNRAIHARHSGVQLLIVLCACILLLCASPLGAQSPPPVKFLGVPASVFTSGITFPIGLAVDTSGNVYIDEYSGIAVYKETLQSDGSYVRSTIASGFPYGPVGLAVDSAGNVYIGLDIGSENSSLIKETLQGNGSYVQTYIGTGLQDVYGIAVDSSGNVYATNNNEAENVYKFIPSGSTYTSHVIFTSPGGILAGLALDSSGDLFVTKEYASTIYKLTPTGSPATTTTYTSATISTTVGSAFDIAVDASGDLYVADTSGYLRLETPNGGTSYTETILASGLGSSYGVTVAPSGTIFFSAGSAVDDFSPAAVNLGTRAIKTTSTASTLNYTIQPSTVVNAINVTTQGVTNTQSGSPEFVKASGGTCTVQTYSDLTTCSVKVTFTPQYPGLRTGAVEFLDGSGNVLSTVYLYGIGTAPVAGFTSGTTSLPAITGLGSTPLNGPRGQVFDAAGNLYIADSSNNRIVKAAPGGAATVLSTPEITLNAPAGVAIDGAGNLYIADSGNGRVVQLTSQGVASVLGTNSISLGTNYGVAVDGLGNVYTSDATNNRVLEFPNIGSPHVFATTGVTLGSAGGVAADGAGNVFIADTSNARIVKVTSGTGTVLGMGSLTPALASPQAVAVDAVGNVYVSDSGNNRIVEVSAGTTNGLVLATGTYTLTNPDCAAADNLGDLYICDAGNNRILIGSLETPAPFSFNAPLATQSVKMLNLGNSALTLAVPTSGHNPGFGTSNFTLLNAGTTGYCPQLSTSSSSSNLTAGSACTLDVEFSPGSNTGTLTDTLTVTDNQLGVALSTQAISLSGLAIPTPTVTLTPAPASPIAYGQAQTALGVAVTYTEGTPTGLVSFTDGDSSLGSSIALSGGVGTFAAQYYPPGTHSFQASYGGDSNFNPAASSVVPYVVNKAGSTLGGPTGTVLITLGASGSIPVTTTGQFAGEGIATPTGSVSYSITNSGSTVVASGSPSIVSGAATVLVGNTLASGLYGVALNYAGDANYNAATAVTVALRIGSITPTINWTQPAQITYGTALGGILNATATHASTAVPGSFTYAATPTGGSAPSISASTLLDAGTYTLSASFTPTDAVTYGPATGSVSLIVGKATPLIAWPAPAAITYGTALGSALNPAASFNSSTVAGTFAYTATPTGGSALSVTSTTQLVAGSYTLTATFTPADTANYALGQTASVSMTVGKATPAISWAAPAAILYGTALGSALNPAATFNSSTVPGTFVYTATPAGGIAASVAAATVLDAGNYSLAASFTPSDTANYSSATATAVLAIGQASSSAQLVSQMNPVLFSNPVSLTATLSSAAGTPTGTVNFLDGVTPIGTAPLLNGIATLTLSTLTVGSHSISAVYAGGTNFSALASPSLNQMILDFTATAGGGSGSSGSATQTVVPGGAAVFSLTIAPTSGIMFPTAAVLTVTGLPTGASSSISPASWVQTSATSWTYPANTTLTNVELTIQLPSATASIDRKSQPGSSLPPVLWGLLLVPFTSRIRRKLSRLGNTISVLLLLAVACIVAAGVTGCGSSQGFFNQGPQTYNIDETVTSGALSHSATFTLTVE